MLLPCQELLVPLESDGEGMAGQLDRLDGAVARVRNGLDATANFGNRLTMEAVHEKGRCAYDRPKARTARQCDPVQRVHTVVIQRTRIVSSQIGREPRSAQACNHLHAGADSKDRLSALNTASNNGPLYLEALAWRRHRQAPGKIPAIWIGKPPPAREHAFKGHEHGLYDLRKIGNPEGQTAGIADGLKIGLRGLVAVATAARVLIQDDGDPWTLRHG